MTTPVGPDFIALQVRDLAASRKFYLEIFGFEVSANCPPGAVIFKTEPIPLALREPVHPLPEAGPLCVGMVLWIACADAVSARVPDAKFGGPDVASNSDWITRFVEIAPPRMGARLTTLSGHYYASGPPDDADVNIENLLAGDPRVGASMAQIMPAARRLGRGLTGSAATLNDVGRGGATQRQHFLVSSMGMREASQESVPWAH